MQPTIAQERPPYVEFRQVPIFNRLASEEAGRQITDDVNYAFIMQAGSKDQVERVADDWIKQIFAQAANGSYNHEWAQAFKKKYEDWKKGIEGEVDGTSIKNAPFLSPAQVQNLLALRIMTIEDLAQVTEAVILNLGHGGRDLREKARAFLEAANGAGKASERITSLERQLEAALAALEQQKSQIEELNADRPKRGRPPLEKE